MLLHKLQERIKARHDSGIKPFKNYCESPDNMVIHEACHQLLVKMLLLPVSIYLGSSFYVF